MYSYLQQSVVYKRVLPIVNEMSERPWRNKLVDDIFTRNKKKSSRNYGREPTFHILYSSRYFNTKKMKKNPKNSKIENQQKIKNL